MKVATELQQVSLPFDEGGKENVMMMEQFVLHEVETPLYSGLGEVLFAGLEFVSFQIEPEYLEADGQKKKARQEGWTGDEAFPPNLSGDKSLNDTGG